MICTLGGWQGIAAFTLSVTLLIGGTASAQTSDTAAPAKKLEAKPTPATTEVAATEAPVAEEEEKPTTQTLDVYDKRIRLVIPATWKVVEPSNNLVEVEISIPPKEAATKPTTETETDEAPLHGRLTMMSAGGEVDSNIRRWVGQFRLGRDAGGKDAMRRDERKLRGARAHLLDITGTYFESPQGRLGQKVERPDYRMLGAIIEVEGAGKFFVKFYGPAKLVECNREAFDQMLDTLQVLDPDDETADDSEADTKATDEPAPTEAPTKATSGGKAPAAEGQ